MNIIFNSPFYHWFYLQPHCAIIRDDLCCSNLDCQFYLILGPAFFFLACPVCAVKHLWGKPGKKRRYPRSSQSDMDLICDAYTVAASKRVFSPLHSQSCLFPSFHCPTAPQGLAAGVTWSLLRSGGVNEPCSISPHFHVLKSVPYLYQLISDPANNSLFQLLFAACVGLW